jgi:opacity protein-like surface antigen
MVAMLTATAGAQAADMPDFLRGSIAPTSATRNWDGWYVGGQGAWAYSAQTFTGSTMDSGVLSRTISGNVISQISGISAPTPLGTTWRGSVGYGAFTGYNWQWDEAVVGLEMSYMHGDFGGGVSATRQFVSGAALSDALFHAPTVTSTSSITVTDYATFRARAAYAYGSFLPYLFGGLALGYANISTSAKVDDFVSANAGGPFTASSSVTGIGTGSNHMIYGYAGGLGVDVHLIGGLFMRAEWEYVRFATQVDTSMNTVRGGLGYKF